MQSILRYFTVEDFAGVKFGHSESIRLADCPLTGSADVPRPAVRIVKNSRPKRVFSPDRDKKSGVENHAAAQIIR